MTRRVAQSLVGGLLLAWAARAAAHPAPLFHPHPDPEPALPAGWPAFHPPAEISQPPEGAPAIAEWTRSALAGECLAVAGANLGHASFTLFTQAGGLAQATLTRATAERAMLILPPDFEPGAALLWPRRGGLWGRAVPVNTADAWWVGPNQASPGQVVSVYGRNLALGGKPGVYLEPASGPGVWARVVASNPYKVDFEIPADLLARFPASGTWDAWEHNGWGGHWGWSGPLPIRITEAPRRERLRLNLRDFGAAGDGSSDDSASMDKALEEAGRHPGCTLFIPQGTYRLSRGCTPPDHVAWQGEGMEKSRLVGPAGLLQDQQAEDLSFSDLSLEGRGDFKDALVRQRSCSAVRYTRVRFQAPGRHLLDLHQSSQIFLKDCRFIGGNEEGMNFMGAASQVFVQGCRFEGTQDCNVMFECWGGEGISVTGCTARDFDNRRPDGWAQGRFLYGNGVWGSNRHIYAADNRTVDLGVRPGFWNQNSGEQFLWEGQFSAFQGHPKSAGPDSVTLQSWPDQDPAGLEAVVAGGPGLGQHRWIRGFERGVHRIYVEPPWLVAPTPASTLVLASVLDGCVLYKNRISGKESRPSGTASCGIQAYGNAFDFIADQNNIRRVGKGLVLWGRAQADAEKGARGLQPCLFSLVQGNQVQDAGFGVLSLAADFSPEQPPDEGVALLGEIFRGNAFRRCGTGLAFSKSGALPQGRWIDFNAVEHNTCKDSATAVDMTSAGLGWNLGYTLVYDNRFSRGKAALRGSAGLTERQGQEVDAKGNQYEGFETNRLLLR